MTWRPTGRQSGDGPRNQRRQYGAATTILARASHFQCRPWTFFSDSRHDSRATRLVNGSSLYDVPAFFSNRLQWYHETRRNEAGHRRTCWPSVSLAPEDPFPISIPHLADNNLSSVHVFSESTGIARPAASAIVTAAPYDVANIPFHDCSGRL